MILKEIVAYKKSEIERQKKDIPFVELKKRLEKAPPPRGFAEALKSKSFSLIAEIKRFSPSLPLGTSPSAKDLDVFALAKEYESGEAVAISVLTDEKYFGGRLEDLEKVKKAVKIPVLRKDFIIDEYQIYQSRVAGADALLLIAGILTDAQLDQFLKLTRHLGMQALVEVHTIEEAERVLKTGAQIVGINNRDLSTFKVDLEVTLKIIARFPDCVGRVLVSESGINSARDVKMLKDKGVRAILVGEALLKSKDVRAKIKELS